MEGNSNKRHRDRLRIFLIIYHFSEPFINVDKPHLVGLLKSEVRIQKLDFLIRYPSYLCYELILKMQEDPLINRNEIETVVKTIFSSQEPQLRTQEMKKFLYGAWEDLDKTISFLMAHGLIDFDSKVGSNLKKYDKEYFLTQLGKDKIEAGLRELPGLQWYQQRCNLIKKYFGDMKGSELKALQYEHDAYKGALINDYIKDIAELTEQLYNREFQKEIYV